MQNYVICFTDFTGRVYSTAWLEAQSDRHAIEKARRIHRSSIGQGYEISCQGRHVHTERSDTPTFGLTHRSTQSSAA